METYRLFIAAELPEQIKDALVSAQEQLRRDRPPVRWVGREAMHLTLKFLGETDTGRMPDIQAAMRQALAGQPVMPLHLAGAGAFPSLRRPNVVWVGIGGATEQLARTQDELETALAEHSFAREGKPFRAHLTLGRVRREATPEQQQRLGAAIRALPLPERASWLAERVVLFRSELQREGPVYTALDSIRL